MLVPDIQKQSATWVISTDKTGHVNQCLTLCALLNWPIDQIIKVPGASATDPSYVRLKKYLQRLSVVRTIFSTLNSDKPLLRIVASGHSSEAVVAHYKKIYGDRLFSIYVGSPKSTQTIFDVAVASLHEVVNENSPIYPSAQQTVWISGVLTASIARTKEASPLPLSAVFIGGANKGYDLSLISVERQLKQVLAASQDQNRRTVIVFSRRTPYPFEAELRHRLSHYNVDFISRDNRHGLLEMISKADHFYVTPDSITMVCEALSTRMPVQVFDLPIKDPTASAVRFIKSELISGRILQIGHEGHHDVVLSDDGIQRAIVRIEQSYTDSFLRHKPQQTFPRRNIWVLTGGRIGDLKQMKALAANLEGQVTFKQLEFRKFFFRPPSALMPFLLKSSSRRSLRASPPQMIISAESRASAVAIKIKKKHPEAKLVCLTRPRGGFEWFDLIITTPQYGLPKADNILEIELPLTISTQMPQSTKKNKVPHIALLVGGESAPHVMNRQVAIEMCQQVDAYIKEKKGILLCSTSFRTGKDVEDVLFDHFGSTQNVFLWSKAGQDNPYGRFLAEADEFIVTADSVSMVADAVATGKPVMVYNLPTHWSRSRHYIQSLWRMATLAPPRILSYGARLLFEWGIFEPLVDREALYDRLEEQNLVSKFGSEASGANRRRTDDMALVTERINRL